MTTVTIGEKTYDVIEGNYAAWRAIQEKYPDQKNMKDWEPLKFDDLVIDAILLILKDKPFQSREEIISVLKMTEMKEIQKDIFNILYGPGYIEKDGKKEQTKN
jgi:hypothetical protein